jgi:hypothetical protein
MEQAVEGLRLIDTLYFLLTNFPPSLAVRLLIGFDYFDCMNLLCRIIKWHADSTN